MADDRGVNVINATATLRRLSVEVAAMLAEVEQAALDPAAPLAMSSEGVTLVSTTDPAVADGWLLTFEVRRKGGRGRPGLIGQLSLLVDVGREGGPAVAAGRPCVVVAWNTRNDPWTEALHDGDFWPTTSENHDIVADRLLLWHEREPGEDPAAVVVLAEEAWFHVVPLYAVTGADDVRRLLLRPFSRLLAGDRPEDVFADPDASMRVAWLGDGTLGLAPADG